jgi:DNA-binding GntR family transcriptional regulator
MVRGDRKSFKETPPIGMAQQAYRLLEHAIIVGDLAPDQVLSEPDLMKATGLGRTAIRDAIQLLADNHLVTIAPYRGAFVSHLTPQTEFLLLEMRRELDPVLAKSTAENASPADRRKLRQFGQKVRTAVESRDSLAVMDIDGQLKELMLEICQNPFMATALRPIYAVCRRFYFGTIRAPDPSFAEIYLELIEALASGHSECAAAKSIEVIDKVEDIIARRQLGGAKR